MKNPISRRQALAVLTAPVLLSPLASQAQQYPARMVRVVVPHTAGATVDNLARNLSQSLAERWSTAVVVENKPGASSIIGTDMVAKAPADGYTLLFAAVTLVQMPHLFKKLPFDPLNSFTPIAQTGQAPVWFVVHKDVPANTMQEFMQLARSAPGTYTFASAGKGTTPHLYGQELSRQVGNGLLHVPYKGTAPSMIDLLAGRVSSLFVNYSDARQHVQRGNLRVLASTGTRRSRFTPEVPTLSELGIKGFESLSWTGFFAPAGTPADIVRKIAMDVRLATANPEFQSRLAELCVETFDNTPEEFAAMTKRDFANWRSLIANAGIEQTD